MTEEIKIVLAIHNDSALYLFESFGVTEFVVAYPDGAVKVGDHVSSWFSGHYFNNLEKALAYLKKR